MPLGISKYWITPGVYFICKLNTFLIFSLRYLTTIDIQLNQVKRLNENNKKAIENFIKGVNEDERSYIKNL